MSSLNSVYLKIAVVVIITFALCWIVFIRPISLRPASEETNRACGSLPPVNLPPSHDDDKGPKWVQSGATGKLFSGALVRKFPKDGLKFNTFIQRSESSIKTTIPDSAHCSKWAVLTTIFEPSEAVFRQVKLKNWCLVIVFDKKSPKTYNTGWEEGHGNKAVVHLRTDEQIAMDSSFVNRIPWNHFGRKNIGYFYAIAHGAKVIWDFDDDNILKISRTAEKTSPDIDKIIPDDSTELTSVLEPKDHKWPTYNPYPSLGAPTLPSWPRGLPLDDIKLPNCSVTPLHEVRLKASSIAVLQSLADKQPDVDAIFRITMPIPFNFKETKVNKHLMIPKGALTPYNAQATLHFQPGFFGMFLPITVTGRVSDIWRSYISQRLFWDVGLQVGFISHPLVIQERNVHSNIGDLTSEWDLYTKSKQLVTFLEGWKGKGRTIVERTEELWVALYEHQYVESDDVELVQLWLQMLIDVGYKFPDIVSKT